MFPKVQPLTWGGLRGKFMLFIGTLLFVITGALTLINFKYQQRTITDREAGKARALAEVIRATVREDILSLNQDHLDEHLSAVKAVPEVLYVYAYNGEGHILADGTPENKFRGILLKDKTSLRSVTAHEPLLQFEDDLLDATEPILAGEDLLGGVRVGYSLEQLRSDIAFARNLSFGVGTILSILALLLCYILTKRITDPLMEVTEATEAISDDRFKEPLRIRSGDEIESLANALNRMARSLKGSREALIKSREYTDKIIASILDMLVVTDLSGVISRVNDATCQTLGYERNELEGEHIQKIIHASPFAAVNPGKHPEGPHVFVGEKCNFTTKDGRTIKTSFSGSIIYDDDQEVAGYVGLAQDITDRLAAENELRMRAMQHTAVAELGQLALSSPSLQQVMDEAVQHVANTLDVSHNSVCELLPEKNALLLRAGKGWPEGVIGKAWVSADIDTHSGYTLSVNRPVVLMDLATEQRFKGAPLMREHNLVSGASVVIHGKDGPWGVLAAHAQVRRNFSEDDINFLQSVANIISTSIERHRQEEALIEAKNEAEEMSRLKSSFLANMSHEIRTPLTIMIGYAEALTEMVPDGVRAFAERIEQGGHRLLATLNSVLELSRIQAKELKLNLEDIDISEEVELASRLLNEMASAKDLDLRFERPEEVSLARIDKGSLQRIIDNLVGNAIKFTSRGHVELKVYEDATRVYMTVEDTGIGIGQEFLPYLFDEFKQESTGEARSHEGSGLGLTITRQMVEMHGGRITVESEKGVGTKFTVWFPKIASTSSRPAGIKRAGDRKPSASKRSRDRATLPTRRALVLDDSLETRELIRFFLEPFFDMTIVESADAVFNSTWEGTFDIVLLDINIGDEEWSGLDVMAVLRKLPEYEKIPIIAVTAYALPGDEQRFREAGFDGYLSKPFVKATLLGEIERLLGALDEEEPSERLDNRTGAAGTAA
ncbi:MAG: PAS domain S-box protein [Rhodothermia bacterium]|nr:PAS domain S-box protein [Rhodothermia bacterium]